MKLDGAAGRFMEVVMTQQESRYLCDPDQLEVLATLIGKPVVDIKRHGARLIIELGDKTYATNGINRAVVVNIVTRLRQAFKDIGYSTASRT